MINYLRRDGIGRVPNPVLRGRSLNPNNQHFRTAYDRCLNHNDDAINQLAGYVHDERNNLRAYSPFAQREYPNTGLNAVPRATPQQLNTLNNLIDDITNRYNLNPQPIIPQPGQFQAQRRNNQRVQQNRQPRQAEIQPQVQQPQQRSSSSSSRSTVRDNRSTRSSSSASPNTQTLTRLELEALLPHITVDELRNHPQFRRLSRDVQNDLITMWENLHIAQVDRAAINPPAPPNVLGPANAAPNNPPPPGPAPLGPAPANPPPPPNALGPAPAVAPLIRPWFPYIPEQLPVSVRTSLINLQRTLLACFAVFEIVYNTHNYTDRVNLSRSLVRILVDSINLFVMVGLRNSNSFENRRRVLVRVHDMIIPFLMDIYHVFETRLHEPDIQNDLRRFIRYCHLIFTTPDRAAHNSLQLFITRSSVPSVTVSNQIISINQLLQSDQYRAVLTTRIPDIYTQGHPRGREYEIQNLRFSTILTTNNRFFNINRTDTLYTLNPATDRDAFQPADTLPDTPILNAPVVEGAPREAHPPGAQQPNAQHPVVAAAQGVANAAVDAILGVFGQPPRQGPPGQGVAAPGNNQGPPPLLPPNAVRSTSTSRSSRSNQSSSDLTPAEQIGLHPTCKDLLKSGTENGEPIDIINPSNRAFYDSPAGTNLRRFINKLKKSCTKVVNKDRCTEVNLSRLSGELLRKYRQPTHSRMYRLQKRANIPELVTLFRYYNRYPNIFKSSLAADITVAIPPSIDAGGPRRDFMQKAIKQLVSKKLLISINEYANQDVYNFNWNIDIRAIFNIPNTDENKRAIFKFIGSFIAFALINKIPLPYHLNRGILANLLYKPEEITDEEYALFYMLDDASSGSTIVQYQLKDPTTNIEAGGFEFNDDEHKLDPTIPEGSSQNNVTTANYRKYLTLYSKYRLIQEKNSDLALRAFKEGFFISRQTLRKKEGRDITISMLDGLITSTELTNEAIDIIEAKIRQFSRYTGPREQIARWFIQILRGTPPYPTAFATEHSIRTGNDKVPKNHKEFIAILMQWWTGIIGFNNNFAYNLNIGTELLSAHTCSYTLDIPTYTSLDDLYKNLIILGSITAQTEGFQFA
jgi:hypothetical protein